MKVEVQLLNEKGRELPRKERVVMHKYCGALQLGEQRNQSLGRIAQTAQLLSVTDGAQAPLLPALHDAAIVFVRDGVMRIRGFEFVEGAQFGQVWEAKVQ